VETVEKFVLAINLLETTTVKVVYTPVDSSVYNYAPCGINFENTQTQASNSLNIEETNSYPQGFEHVESRI